MAEHTYKPGDVVAVPGKVSWFPPGQPALTAYVDGDRDHPSTHVFLHRVAPWLSVEDQSSLLRVVKAASELISSRVGRYSEVVTSDAAYKWSVLVGAVRDLSPEVRIRAARLSEDE